MKVRFYYYAGGCHEEEVKFSQPISEEDLAMEMFCWLENKTNAGFEIIENDGEEAK